MRPTCRKHGKVLSAEEVFAILDDNRSTVELAQHYSVAKRTIRNIKTGRTWGSTTNHPDYKPCTPWRTLRVKRIKKPRGVRVQSAGGVEQLFESGSADSVDPHFEVDWATLSNAYERLFADSGPDLD